MHSTRLAYIIARAVALKSLNNSCMEMGGANSLAFNGTTLSDCLLSLSQSVHA